MLKSFCDREDIVADAHVHFFPRTCCSAHARRDSRQPGLLKLESSGCDMVRLNSKTYALRTKDRDLKLSTKGLNKNSLDDDECDVLETFQSVLATGNSRSGTNVGFQCRCNTIFTYTQKRWGLSYFYCKREVQSDGVSTRPLRLTLKPAKRNHDS